MNVKTSPSAVDGAELRTAGARSLDCLVRRDERYITEKIEAYNVAIEALRMHESADPQPDRLDFKLRKRLADRLDREIQRWVDALPNVKADPLSPEK